MTDPTRIVLIRHGQSQSQAGRYIAGHSCKGLSPLGRLQAEALRDRLSRTGELGDVSALYSSIMARAVETADIMAPAVGDPPRISECSLCEIHHGDVCEGMPRDRFEALNPPPADWDPHYRRAAGEETWTEMAARVEEAIDGLVDRHPGQRVVVACHGGVIIHTMIRLLGLAPVPESGRARAWLRVPNTSITEFAHHPDFFGDGTPGWELVRYNEHSHLGPDLIG